MRGCYVDQKNYSLGSFKTAIRITMPIKAFISSTVTSVQGQEQAVVSTPAAAKKLVSSAISKKKKKTEKIYSRKIGINCRWGRPRGLVIIITADEVGPGVLL